MPASSFYLNSPDGVRLFFHSWLPDGAPKAIIALVHGQAEHIGRYAHLAAFFNSHGFGVVGFDQRGHGKSGGKRGHTPNYEAYLDGVEQLLNHIITTYPQTPIVLYGHSMGGNIVLGYSVNRPLTQALKCVVSTGAWLTLVKPPSAALVAVARILAKVLPAVQKSNELNINDLATDLEVGKAYKADPLVHDKISFAAGVAMLNAANQLMSHRAGLPVPLLLMHGGADPITSPDATRQFADQQAVGNVTYKLWDGLRHEIHNEPCQLAIFTYTLQWIEKYVN